MGGEAGATMMSPPPHLSSRLFTRLPRPSPAGR